MTQTLPKLVTFEQFIEWYPSNGVRSELHKGVIVEMPPPTGEHENVVGFLAAQITFQFLQMGLPFWGCETAFVKIQSHNSTYSPDILLLNHDNNDRQSKLTGFLSSQAFIHEEVIGFEFKR